MLHLFNAFRENDGKENFAQVLEEEVYKMFGIKSLNDEHDCNVVGMNSLNTMMLMICNAIILWILCLMKMIFSVPRVLMNKFIMMIACLLFMMFIFMKVGLKECQF